MGVATLAGALLSTRVGRAEPAPPLSPPPPIFQGVRPFMGLFGATGVVVMQLPTKDEVDSIFNAQVPSLLFALKAGVLLGRAELGIELAPLTQLYWTIPTAEAHIYGGYHLRLSEKVSWPARMGFGALMSAYDEGVFVHARVDPVGVSIQAESCLIDVHLLSIRMTPVPSRRDGPDGFILSWLAGVGVSWPL